MTHFDIIVGAVTLLCIALVVYHHVGYPVILKYLAKRRQTASRRVFAAWLSRLSCDENSSLDHADNAGLQ